jgi:tRNA threonylcarbamoyladenosine biosynthesis protein TsaB
MDSATDACSVSAVTVEGGRGRLLAEREESGERLRAAQLLLPMASAVLEEAGAEQEDICAVVVGTGPGTFTGVRIAVATARALALALGVPVFGVSSLAAVAASAAAHVEDAAPGALLVPFVDARRGQVFAAFFRYEKALAMPGGDPRSVWRKIGPVQALDAGVLLERSVDVAAGNRVLLAGPTVLLQEKVGGGDGHSVLRLGVAAVDLVRGQEQLCARSRDEVSAEKGSSGEDLLGSLLLGFLRVAQRRGPQTATPAPGLPGSPEGVRPIYVRPPDADLHIRKMRDPFA